MPWIKVDDGVHDDLAVEAIGDAALGALLRLEAWASRHLTDRVVPLAKVRKMDAAHALPKLRAAGLVEDEGEDAIRIVASFFNVLTAEELNARRAIARTRRVPDRIRDEVITRDGLNCGICCGAVPLDDVHLDHIIPLSRGGPTAAANLRVTHSGCNLARGNRS